jgi:hypothetical protein
MADAIVEGRGALAKETADEAAPGAGDLPVVTEAEMAAAPEPGA